MERNSKFSLGAWHRMSDRPTIQTVGKAEIRCQLARLLATVGACLLFQAYFIPFTNGSGSDIVQFSSALEEGSSPCIDLSSLVVLRSRDHGTSDTPLVFAGDFLVCVETEDTDPFDEGSRQHQASAQASLIPLGEFSSHDVDRARFLPFLEFHGLMSRRF
jgi:hypothetical protein